MQRLGGLILTLLLSLVGLPAWSTDRANQGKSQQATATVQLTQCALKVSGMTCGGCEIEVQRALLKLNGVKAARADWTNGDVQVNYDAQKTTPEKIVAAFNQANRGFRAQLPKPKRN